MAEVMQEVEKIFKHFDTDHDGKISSSELGEAMKTLGSTNSDDIKQAMDELDKDGDGFISFNELCDFCRANPGITMDVANAL